MWRNTKDSYGSVAKTFHWVIFLLIATLLTVGFIMTDMANTPDKLKLYGLHKSIGVTVLMLALLRLLWKLAGTTPLLPDTLNAAEKFLAHAGHWALYALMLAMPLTGWMMTSAAGLPVSVFGWFTLPVIVAPDAALKQTMRELHGDIAWVLIVVVALHALAALLHHFYYKDNVLRRMLPFVKPDGGNHAPNPDSVAGS